jgi:carbohydrate diacid regulator
MQAGEGGSGLAYLTPTIAQEIAGDTSAIIGLNVIITDAEGIVLGSGDRTRVGTFHEASIGVVARQAVEWHDAQQAARLRGVRPGMTLPILHKGVVVGTVGITGAPDQVTRFGRLVKRQTEILLEEAVLVRTTMTRERVLEALLRDLLDYDPAYPSDVGVRARELGIELRLARRVVVFDIVGSPSLDSASTSPLRLVREAFNHPQDISCSLSPQRHVLFQRAPDAGDGSRGIHPLPPLAERISQSVGGTCLVGVGGLATREQDVGLAYHEALTAIRLGTAMGHPSPYVIADLRVEQLVESVPAGLRERMATDTIAALTARKDWPAVRDTVVAWVESGFVLVAAAERLKIHRNTLVYRLERIAAGNGAAPADRRRWLALYLSCLADAIHPPANDKPARDT